MTETIERSLKEVLYHDVEYVQPPFLKEGDEVALISPAYWMAEETILHAAAVIENWGLRPVIGPNTTCLNVEAYAGTADERAADLRWAFENERIKAVICTRGGYGSIHLLNRIPPEFYQQHPKWLIGHGDITTLLYALTGAGVMCIHGPMASHIGSHQDLSTALIRDLLFGKLPQYQIPTNANNRYGHAEGILVGGNLASYAAIAGTKFQLSHNQDIILFIEECEESLHDIDRLFYMLQLQLNFKNVKGIIFGSFNSIRYDLSFGSVEQMLVAHLQGYDIPVCCGFPAGSDISLPMIEGAPCSLDVTPEGSVLTFNIHGTQQPCVVEKSEPFLMKA
ncbi:LD-carboxypeptidase [Prevotella sp. FD3004]|uniref:S66 peptidase family protein n=1 Tax=Prevotella sp. FD3004 TaxID=1408309 RepID=UPI00068E841A|nr:LD-carboxypeptidase [Prevotella sp. FD3004]